MVLYHYRPRRCRLVVEYICEWSWTSIVSSRRGVVEVVVVVVVTRVFYNVHNKWILFPVSVFAVHPKQSHEIRRNIRGHSAAPNLATETPSGTLRTNGRSKTPQHLVVDMLPMDHPDQDYYPKPKFRSRHRNSNQSRSREEFLGGSGCGGGGGGKGAYMRKTSQTTSTHTHTHTHTHTRLFW